MFGGDGSLTGSAGCNNYTTSYTADEGTITIEPPGSTRKLCPEPEGIMEQESAYLAALEAAETVRLQRADDELLDGEGKTLVTLARAAVATRRASRESARSGSRA